MKKTAYLRDPKVSVTTSLGLLIKFVLNTLNIVEVFTSPKTAGFTVVQERVSDSPQKEAQGLKYIPVKLKLVKKKQKNN